MASSTTGYTTGRTSSAHNNSHGHQDPGIRGGECYHGRYGDGMSTYSIGQTSQGYVPLRYSDDLLPC